MADYSSMSDADLLKLVQPQQSAAPDYKGMSDADLMKLVQPQVSTAEDVKKAIPSKAAQGVINFAGLPGDLASILNRGVDTAMTKLGIQPSQNLSSLVTGRGPTNYDFGTSKQIQGAVEKQTGPLYQPQTTAGKLVGAGIETAANPASYLGPGSLALRAGGALASGVASEGAGQLAEGTGYETPARIAGAVAGGTAAAKSLGPSAAKAATPAMNELRAAAVSGGQHGGYDAALNSDLALDPKGVASWAAKTQQDLNGQGFTGGQRGTAPKTIRAFADLQNSPMGTVTLPSGEHVVVTPTNIDSVRATLKNITKETQPTAEGAITPTRDATAATADLERLAGFTIAPANLNAVRQTLGKIAKEVQPTQGGAIIPTQDAAAATKALGHFANYTENIPQNHIVAGNAAAYSSAVKEANANYASYARVRDFDARLNKAQNATDRQIAGSLDAQIKSKAGGLLDRGARGLNTDEKAQLQLINSGGPVSNTLRQLGRGGAGVIPMGLHLAGAVASGGASIPASLGIGVPLYAARKASEAITKSRANKLVEMLAQRSPEYQQRVASLPHVSTAPNKAAIVRALLAAH